MSLPPSTYRSLTTSPVMVTASGSLVRLLYAGVQQLVITNAASAELALHSW
jgi:hypothetical protein